MVVTPPGDPHALTGIGEALRAARVARGRSVDEVAHATQIRADFLHALEDERFIEMGGHVYAKGFLRTYARALGLDPEPMLDTYRSDVEGQGYDTRAMVPRHLPRTTRPRVPHAVVVAAVPLALVVVAALAVRSLGGAAPEPAPEPSVTVPVSPSPRPAPAPTASMVDGILLELTVGDQPVTVSVSVDGATRVDNETIPARATLGPYDADTEIRLRLSDAGAVALTFNGLPVTALGEPGQEVDIVCTVDGCRVA